MMKYRTNFETQPQQHQSSHLNGAKQIYMNESNMNEQCILFLESVQNKIMHGTFTHVIYSNELFSTKSIYYLFHINIINMGQFYNKNIYKFNPIQSSLTKIKCLEQCILSNYKHTMKNPNKTPDYKIQKNLNSGSIKIFTQVQNAESYKNNNNNSNVQFCLKIIGIWESDTEYGIIYKFLLF